MLVSSMIQVDYDALVARMSEADNKKAPRSTSTKRKLAATPGAAKRTTSTSSDDSDSATAAAAVASGASGTSLAFGAAAVDRKRSADAADITSGPCSPKQSTVEQQEEKDEKQSTEKDCHDHADAEEEAQEEEEDPYLGDDSESLEAAMLHLFASNWRNVMWYSPCDAEKEEARVLQEAIALSLLEGQQPEVDHVQEADSTQADGAVEGESV